MQLNYDARALINLWLQPGCGQILLIGATKPSYFYSSIVKDSEQLGQVNYWRLLILLTKQSLWNLWLHLRF
jgi:hypothetical protein